MSGGTGFATEDRWLDRQGLRYNRRRESSVLVGFARLLAVTFLPEACLKSRAVPSKGAPLLILRSVLLEPDYGGFPSLYI
jgi:hypothetical protein